MDILAAYGCALAAKAAGKAQAGGPSVLIAYGEGNFESLRNSKIHGALAHLRGHPARSRGIRPTSYSRDTLGMGNTSNNHENGNNANTVLYAGLAWKHHIAEHFENGSCPTHPNGAGKGATIFTDYQKMIDYLKVDGRRWYIAELKLENEPLLFKFGNNYMATIQRDFLSEQGFQPCI